jgi:hypothetical protein
MTCGNDADIDILPTKYIVNIMLLYGQCVYFNPKRNARHAKENREKSREKEIEQTSGGMALGKRFQCNDFSC